MRLLAALLIAAAALLVAGLAGAVADPVVVNYRVPIEGLSRPLRVVQLADIHGSEIDMPTRRIGRIVALANAQKPDLVVIPGDLVGGKLFEPEPMRVWRVIAELQKLRAPLGRVAVMGNHDAQTWTPAAFAGTGLTLLAGSYIDVGPLLVAGADSRAHLPPPAPGLNAAIAAAPPGKPLISLSHEPETFQEIQGRSQLHFAGHTHGGQVWLPPGWHFYLNPFLEAHRRGLFRENGRWLLVSSGLGTSIVPLRLGVPPEIVVVDLVPAAGQALQN